MGVLGGLLGFGRLNRAELKSILGPRWTVRLRTIARGRGVPRWGNLRRVRPFSGYFGFDRGTPVDRYFLHRFLEQHRQRISGDVLEIQSPGYTRRYGHSLRRADSVDINPASEPTYLCDLADSGDVIPTASYDCLLLPNTLNMLRDVEGCMRHALRVVRPGGVILASAAALVPLTPDVEDYWHLSADGWRELVRRVWGGCEVEVHAHGNCLVAVAAMLGLALEELTERELAFSDPQFPVLVTLFCRKPAAPARGDR